VGAPDAAPHESCESTAGHDDETEGDRVKPHLHAKTSVKKWGGAVEDYLDIHEFLDSSKAHVADMRHRVILHSSFGIYIAQRVFGEIRANSAGRVYAVRDIAEDHVLEDLGTIPSVERWLANFKIESFPSFVGGPRQVRSKTFRID
jgi:hypothetical protein